MLRGSRHVTREQLNRALAPLEERITRMEASQAANQATIDAETQAVQALNATVKTAMATIQTEVNTLKAAQAAGQTLDFTALQAAITASQTDASALGAIVPDTIVPTATDPAPVPTATDPVPAPNPAAAS